MNVDQSLRKCLAITGDRHRLVMEECTVNNPRQVKNSFRAQKNKEASKPFFQVWTLNLKKNDERNADK